MYLNFTVGESWRSTLNKFFQQLRRIRFLTLAQETALIQGSLLYGDANDSLTTLVKDTNASRYLSNQGEANNPSWNQVNLVNGVTGTLPEANGGTGLTSLAWAGWSPSPSSSAGTGTYTVFNARYARIGKTYHCCLYLRWSQATAAHAQVSFTLPATAKNNTVGQFYIGVYTEAASGTLQSNGFIVIPSNGTTATIRRDLATSVTWPIAAGSTNYAICNFFFEGE